MADHDRIHDAPDSIDETTRAKTEDQDVVASSGTGSSSIASESDEFDDVDETDDDAEDDADEDVEK